MRGASFRGGMSGTVALVLLIGGCDRNGAAQPAEKAEAAVNKVLDAWTRGEAADRFTGPEHPIQATDPDWQAGYRLQSFLAVESKSDPQNPTLIHCRVSLSLRDTQGDEADKEVVYDVHLGNRIIIQRQEREAR